MHISVCVLRPDDSQNPRLLDRRDPTAYGPTSRGCTSSLPYLGLPIRSPAPPLSLHCPGLSPYHYRRRGPTNNPPGISGEISRYLSSRHGLLLRWPHHYLLVRHEPKWAHRTEYWYWVDDWIR